MRSNVSNVFSVWDDLFGDFDQIWKAAQRCATPLSCNADSLVDSTFPPCNMSLSKDKNLLLEFAVAGYGEDEINLEYEKDHLVVTLTPNAPPSEESDFKVLRRGIKRSKATTKVYVPASLYDQSSIGAHLENGILSIQIDSLGETKPQKIAIGAPKRVAIDGS